MASDYGATFWLSVLLIGNVKINWEYNFYNQVNSKVDELLKKV
jgi:hypothetical protein